MSLKNKKKDTEHTLELKKKVYKFCYQFIYFDSKLCLQQ